MILTTDFRDKLCKLLDDEDIIYHYSNIIFKKISLEEYNRTKAKLEVLGSYLEISTIHNILNIDYSSEAVREYLSSKYGLRVIKTLDNHIGLEGGASKDHFIDRCYIGIEHTENEQANVYIYDIAFIVNDYMEFSLITQDRFQMIPVNCYDLSDVDFDETLELSQELRGVQCNELILPHDIFESSKQRRRNLIKPFKGLIVNTLDLTNTNFGHTNVARDLFSGLVVKELKLGTLDLSHLSHSLGNFGKVFDNCDIINISIDKILLADEYMKADFIASMSGSRNESIAAINGEYDTLLNNYKKLRDMIEVVKK